MPRFAANLSMLYNEHEFLDRFAAAAKDGFTAVEYLFPYAFDAKVLRQCLDDHGLQQVLFNAPPGDWDAGERGLACLPGRENEFQTGFLKALDYANTLDCPRIHVMAGLMPKGADHETLEKTYIQNIAWAATQAQKTGCDVLIEPINTRDIPGFFLNYQDKWTCTTAKSWRATWPPRFASTCQQDASVISKSQVCQCATSQTWGNSTTPTSLL
ncbi:MAG: hypothetical protein RL707_1775 [Pseudomonadota bacterium]